MKTYYIVQCKFEHDEVPRYRAFYKGVLSFFNIFCCFNYVLNTYSSSADECENTLRNIVQPFKARLIRVVKI